MMKICEVVERILDYHPTIAAYGSHPERECDGYKCGDPMQECTGIVTAATASVKVIQQAIEKNCNLIVVHEPVFYTHLDPTDWLLNNEVFMRKMELLDNHGIVIWRDHDHAHAHKPDVIFDGIARMLGWQGYTASKQDNPDRALDFVLPQTTVGELARYVKEKMRLNAVRIIGDPEACVSRVGLAGMHIQDNADNAAQAKPTQEFIRRECDVMITMECIDWTLASYVKDAAELGMPKALIMAGHMNLEELGMEWAAQWIGEVIDHALPVCFVPACDMYQYVL